MALRKDDVPPAEIKAAARSFETVVRVRFCILTVHWRGGATAFSRENILAGPLVDNSCCGLIPSLCSDADLLIVL